MTMYNTEDLTSYKLQKLLLRYTHSEIADLYGVSRQRIHQIYDMYVEQELISKGYPRGESVSNYNSLDVSTNVRYNIDIISLHKDKNKLLVSIDGTPPRWIGLYRKGKGVYFRWSFNMEGKLKRRNAFLRDFTATDENGWQAIINNIKI